MEELGFFNLKKAVSVSSYQDLLLSLFFGCVMWVALSQSISRRHGRRGCWMRSLCALQRLVSPLPVIRLALHSNT